MFLLRKNGVKISKNVSIFSGVPAKEIRVREIKDNSYIPFYKLHID